jgi:hypothetical protein
VKAIKELTSFSLVMTQPGNRIAVYEFERKCAKYTGYQQQLLALIIFVDDSA